jgi:hypothetical protein
MKIESCGELANRDEYIRLYIDDDREYQVVMEIVTGPERPFPFKGDSELAKKLKEAREKRQAELKKGLPIDPDMDPEEQAQAERDRLAHLELLETLLKTTDGPMLSYTEDWRALREEQRRAAMVEFIGIDEDLPSAHERLVVAMEKMEFAGSDILPMGEEETMAFGELLEAYIILKLKKEKSERADGGGGEAPAGGEPSQPDELMTLLREILNGFKKETNQIRNKQKRLLKEYTKVQTIAPRSR